MSVMTLVTTWACPPTPNFSQVVRTQGKGFQLPSGVLGASAGSSGVELPPPPSSEMGME
jgi:hypothetical protein